MDSEFTIDTCACMDTRQAAAAPNSLDITSLRRTGEDCAPCRWCVGMGWWSCSCYACCSRGAAGLAASFLGKVATQEKVKHMSS